MVYLLTESNVCVCVCVVYIRMCMNSNTRDVERCIML